MNINPLIFKSMLADNVLKSIVFLDYNPSIALVGKQFNAAAEGCVFVQCTQGLGADRAYVDQRHFFGCCLEKLFVVPSCGKNRIHQQSFRHAGKGPHDRVGGNG